MSALKSKENKENKERRDAAVGGRLSNTSDYIQLEIQGNQPPFVN